MAYRELHLPLRNFFSSFDANVMADLNTSSSIPNVVPPEVSNPPSYVLQDSQLLPLAPSC
ncbi:hypothetical protein [Sulfodiicoccus acidiphilus]|uniref:hypothetical protein n=1 Tax=Sulfodiicoccus acidiphilus TaxID=1670455 RepID=UPI000F81EFC6|nr:hypothetical protein [Sulfodiicoccus acidiphilus]